MAGQLGMSVISQVREDFINELGPTITAAAEQLGVTLETFSNLICEWIL